MKKGVCTEIPGEVCINQMKRGVKCPCHRPIDKRSVRNQGDERAIVLGLHQVLLISGHLAEGRLTSFKDGAER